MHRYENFDVDRGPIGLGRRCARAGARLAPLLGMMALASALARATSGAESRDHRHCCDHGHGHGRWDEESRGRRGHGEHRGHCEECEGCAQRRHRGCRARPDYQRAGRASAIAWAMSE